VGKPLIPVAALALVAVALPVHAQSIAFGGGVQRSLQRFDGDPSLNRLDGASSGWWVSGRVRAGHWLARGEFFRDSTIREVDATTLFVGTRTVTVHSELAHDLSAAAALGGYAVDVTRRLELAALGGPSWITIQRTFTTDAARQILVSPSPVPTTAIATTLNDRFLAWAVEGVGGVRLNARVGLTGGLRLERLRLNEDITGWDFAPFVGAAWRVK
jgi:hypothetical protein